MGISWTDVEQAVARVCPKFCLTKLVRPSYFLNCPSNPSNVCGQSEITIPYEHCSQRGREPSSSPPPHVVALRRPGCSLSTTFVVACGLPPLPCASPVDPPPPCVVLPLAYPLCSALPAYPPRPPVDPLRLRLHTSEDRVCCLRTASATYGPPPLPPVDTFRQPARHLRTLHCPARRVTPPSPPTSAALCTPCNPSAATCLGRCLCSL